MRAATNSITGLVLAIVALLTASAACAAGALFKVPTRPDITTSVFWEPADNANATVLLFPGGAGGFGKVEQGRATGANFLVRSAPYFLANGLNVAIIGKPSDSEDLDYADRISETHMADVRKVLEFVKSRSAAPVWLVGTSRGTISATAITIREPEAIAGLVLTSSVVSYRKAGAVPKQDLSAIKVPVLVVHHARDACQVCQPHEVAGILRGLKSAPVKKLVMLDGGANPRGDPCEAFHWHGFVGMEQEAVQTIANWIGQPAN
jgi:predicted esterase